MTRKSINYCVFITFYTILSSLFMLIVTEVPFWMPGIILRVQLNEHKQTHTDIRIIRIKCCHWCVWTEQNILKTKRLHHYWRCVYFRRIKCVLLPWNLMFAFIYFKWFPILNSKRWDIHKTPTHATKFASLNWSPLRHSTKFHSATIKAVLDLLLLIGMVFFSGNV